MTETTSVSIKRLSPLHWVIIALACLAAAYGMWEFTKPFLAERHFRDGFNAFLMHQYDLSVRKLEKAVHYAPWESHYFVQLGKSYEAQAQEAPSVEEKKRILNKAVDVYLYIIELDDKNPWYMNRLAVAYQQLAQLSQGEEQERYNRLVAEYTKAAATVDPNNPLFQLNYAYYLHQQGQLDEAIPYYVKTIEIDDRILEARFNLADLYKRKGETAKALEQYLEIYKKDPEFNQIKLVLASHYLHENDYESALPFLEEEIKTNPRNMPALKTLAGVYYKAERWQNAANAYGLLYRLAEEDRDEMLPYYIHSLLQIGQVEPARSVLRDYLAANPGNDYAQRQLRRIEEYLKNQP